MALNAKAWLGQLHALPLHRPVRVMNVCGGHERTITQAGLRGALPPLIELIPGPGCPVCVCPEEDIHQALQLALHEPITLVAFGDMLRVPVNLPKGEPRSLDQAHAAGADIRPIASPLEALQIARDAPARQVVLFAAGFETTTAPVASLLVQGVPDNLSILLSGRLTWPAVSMLLNSDTPGFDALVAPGHVATVMGPEDWEFVIEQHHLPAAVAGFSPESLLAAIYSVLRQHLDKRRFLDNCYPELVRPGGNPSAKHHLRQALDVVDANWRGIGIIPASGYALNQDYAQWDARKRFPDYDTPERKRAGKMPPGCDCAQVVLGRKYPNQCRLYGEACTPRSPIGPCMVSDEGACRIWWSGGIRNRATG
ncbi:MAG: hydrogenase formation protein HypD [Candidatus Thiodiazotropha sp. (ex Epidulcina cf. delphinae)]|nr:hydrogenase formation protein HypD [Candidatus Thiodiazotropha sp. (ex Epidulcina cf. delphinae)]